MKGTKYIFLLFSIVLIACDSEQPLSTNQALESYAKNAQNGFIKQRTNSVFRMKATLSATLVVPSDSPEVSNVQVLCEMSPVSKGNSGQLIHRGIWDEQTRKMRAMDISFYIEEMLSMSTDDVQIEPLLVHSESTHGLDKNLTVHVVFPPTVLEGKADLTFTFEDKIFGTGVNRLVFLRSDIDRLLTKIYNR